MSDYAMCPHCDRGLFIDDCFDITFDRGKIISHWRGHCTECGKNFRWEEVYLFDHIENFVEDND